MDYESTDNDDTAYKGADNENMDNENTYNESTDYTGADNESVDNESAYNESTDYKDANEVTESALSDTSSVSSIGCAVLSQANNLQCSQSFLLGINAREVISEAAHSCTKCQRKGQRGFRAMVEAHYGGHCALTNEKLAVQACHILPYSICKSNELDNAIVLASDLHYLFDAGKWTIVEEGEYLKALFGKEMRQS